MVIILLAVFFLLNLYFLSLFVVQFLKICVSLNVFVIKNIVRVVTWLREARVA